MTQLPPSPFISNPSVIQPPTEGPAVALSRTSVLDAQTGAAAEPYRYLGNFAACEPWAAQGMSCDDCMVEWTGCWDNFQCPKCGKGELPNCNLPDLIDEPSMTNGGDQEAPASAPSKNPDVGVLDATDCIHEIFHWVRKLMKQPSCFVLDEPAFMADVEEEPLFIRDGDHLRRWEA